MLHKIIFFQIFLNSISTFLVQDFSYNTTTAPHGQSPGDTALRDLMNLIFEEKRIRYQLEDRLNAAENEINKMKQYDIAVSGEVEKEKNELEQLRIENQILSDQLANVSAKNSLLESKLNEKNLLLESRIDYLWRNITKFSSETVRETANLSMNVHSMELQIAEFSENLRNISNLATLHTRSDGFTVYTPELGTGVSSALKFTLQGYNSNHVFNLSTGEFVCQQSGLYLFIFTIIRDFQTGEGAYCRLFKNNETNGLKFALTFDNNSNNYATGTGSSIFHLQSGDRVYLSECLNSQNFQIETTFTGCLLHANG